MELRQVKYVLTMAETGNMTRAAELLHVSQSALSLSYRNLEAEFGIALFRKKGRLLELTDAGQLFCEKARLLLAQSEELVFLMEQMGSKNASRFTFCTEAVDFSEEAALLFEAFFPDVSVNRVRESTRAACELLRKGECEFVLSLEPSHDPGFQSQLLLDEPMYALVCKSSDLAKRDALTLKELVRLPLITQYDGYAINCLFRTFFSQAGLPLDDAASGRIVEVGDPEMIALRVAKGYGISFIPESTCHSAKDAEILSGTGCTAIPLTDTHCRRQVYLISRKKKCFHPLSRAFADFLIDFGLYAQAHHRFPDQTAFSRTVGFQLVLDDIEIKNQQRYSVLF